MNLGGCKNSAHCFPRKQATRGPGGGQVVLDSSPAPAGSAGCRTEAHVPGPLAAGSLARVWHLVGRVEVEATVLLPGMFCRQVASRLPAPCPPSVPAANSSCPGLS